MTKGSRPDPSGREVRVRDLMGHPERECDVGAGGAISGADRSQTLPAGLSHGKGVEAGHPGGSATARAASMSTVGQSWVVSTESGTRAGSRTPCLENPPLRLANDCLAGFVPASAIELRPSVARLGRVISTEVATELLIREATTPEVPTGSPE